MKEQPGTARKHVYVVGGSRGIGAAMVGALLAEGYDVTVAARDSRASIAPLFEELGERWRDRRLDFRFLDVGDVAQVDAFGEALAEDDDCYGLVYNAGQSYDMLAAAVDMERARALMQVNFLAFMQLAARALRPMMRARRGRIVATGSVTALYGAQGNSTYAATKGAMLGYVRTLAVEIARKGVTVNYIAPGFVDTDLLEPYRDHLDRIAKQVPAGRLARAQEIADLAAFLLSSKAGYITGAVHTIDGGLSTNLISRRG